MNRINLVFLVEFQEVSHANEEAVCSMGKSSLKFSFCTCIYGHYNQRIIMDVATFLFITPCSCVVLCGLSSVVITKMVSWFPLSL